jgi:hypothetical protein
LHLDVRFSIYYPKKVAAFKTPHTAYLMPSSASRFLDIEKTREVGLLSAAASGNLTNGRRPWPAAHGALGRLRCAAARHREKKRLGKTGLRSELLMRPNAQLRRTAPCGSSQPGLTGKQKLHRIRTCRVDGQAVDSAEN